MHRRHRIRLTATLAAFAAIVPAVAATAADTTVTFEVAQNAGGLSIDLASGSTVLSSGAGGLFGDAQSYSGSLPATTVTDVRGGLLRTWDVTVSATDFTHSQYVPGDDDFGAASLVVDSSNARAYFDVAGLGDLTFGALTGVTVTGAELVAGTNDLGSAYSLISGTTPLGNGSITYTPTIAVDVPANTPAGTYTGTVTQTVS